MKKQRTNEELLKILHSEYINHGSAPKGGNRQLQGVHTNIFLRRFGKWNDALRQAGIPESELTIQKPGGTETIACAQCGTMFTSNLSREQRFCSRLCYSASCAESNRMQTNLTPTRDEWKREVKRKSATYLFTTDFDELGWDYKRKRVLHEQQGKCNCCGLSEWRGIPISLEVDHKDGFRTNNARENLEALCPNCHSITDTWRGRNKPANNGKNVVQDKTLLQHLQDAPNIRQGLLRAGLAAKGANYERAKQLLNKNLGA